MDKKRIALHLLDATPEDRSRQSLFLAGFALGMLAATVLAVML